MTPPDHNALARHQLELLRPHEIRDLLAARPLVYMPLGTIEWHAEHLPVGLDALTAHGICLRAAARSGGLVYPPLHYGTGGGHGLYPWTVMLDGTAEIAGLLRKTLARLQDFGVERTVLFSGHFPDAQLAMIDALAAEWNAAGQPMSVRSTAVNQIEGAALGPDHAGIFETTLLHALWPQRVDISRLPEKDPSEAVEEDGWGPQRHDPGHPLWGVVGPDPRDFRADGSHQLLETCVDWLVSQAESN